MNTYEKGCFTIQNQIMKIDNKTINLANVDNLVTFEYDRHSLFANIKEWLIGLIIFLIIGLIWKKISFLFDLYLFTFILLFYYNYKEHQKRYYGLKIRTAVTNLIIRSNDKVFIDDVLATIENAISSKKCTYTINLDNRFINNGIVNKGNKNKNNIEVNYDK